MEIPVSVLHALLRAVYAQAHHLHQCLLPRARPAALAALHTHTIPHEAL